MCGIVGAIGKNINEEFIHKSIKSLKHRGPDGDGFWLNEQKSVFLGQTRLAIIDLSDGGRQPMIFTTSNGEKFIIVFNGEIYNYKEIKKELIILGHKFVSDSDTEVVLQSFIQWGKGCVDRFVGMFAFSIYSSQEDKIYICRDRFGVKPLYYYLSENNFIFASELKALYSFSDFKKEINHEALSFYFQLGYIPSPHTIFKNTYKLESASWLEIDSDFNIEKNKYWTSGQYFTGGYLKLTEPEVVEQLEEKLKKSFYYRMVADVDVGIFLSGGIDSSLVTAILQKNSERKIKTFSLGFQDKKFDEAIFAKKIAEKIGTDHYELYVSAKDVSNSIEDYIKLFSEPFGDSSGLPTYLLSKFVKQHVKVVLSGDGGDELFGGYTKYEIVSEVNKMNKIKKDFLKIIFRWLSPDKIAKIYNLLPIKKYSNLREKMAKFSNLIFAENLFDQFRLAGTYWTEKELDNLLTKQGSNNLSQYFKFDDKSFVEDQMQLCDINLYLPDDIMVKTDRSTMAVGLEGREPFLDHNVLEFISKINPNIKNKEYGSKYLLKQILFKYLDKDLFNRPKTGFRPPLKNWLQNELSEKIDYYLSQEKIKKQGFFNHVFVKKMIDDFRSDKKYVNPDKLWFLLVFQMWYENFYE